MSVFDILDTAGQEEYMLLRDPWIISGEGFVITFSITSKSSFENAIKMVDHVKRIKKISEDLSFVLVGNKSDLEDQREVTKEEAFNYAISRGVKKKKFYIFFFFLHIFFFHIRLHTLKFLQK